MYAMNIQNDVIGLVLCENCKSKLMTDIIAWPSRCHGRIYGIYFLQKQVPVFPRQAQLEEFLTFSVKDRYQLNYFICIKYFNAQKITSWKLNLFSFIIYYCDCTYMNHERKTIRLDTEVQYLLSCFPGVSILQLLIIYHIYD